jgi:hypothetical protein
MKTNEIKVQYNFIGLIMLNEKKINNKKETTGIPSSGETKFLHT